MNKLDLLAPVTQTFQSNRLEHYIRQALASRQLTYRLETEIQSLVFNNTPSRIESMLLDILNDAVKEGYVKRTAP